MSVVVFVCRDGKLSLSERRSLCSWATRMCQASLALMHVDRALVGVVT